MQMHLIVGILIALSIGCDACPEPCRRTDTEVTRRASFNRCVPILQKHVSCLRRVCNNSCIHNLIDHVVFLQDNSLVFYKHELTRLSLKKINAAGNVLPLFESWDIFLKSYQGIESDLFVQEFSIELFFLYKNILSHYTGSKVTVGDIMQLSSQIMSLPMDQVLSALERCYHQFMIIMGHYGVHQGMSLSAWIHQYWWVPPTIVISFVYSALRHFLLPKATEMIGLGGAHADKET